MAHSRGRVRFNRPAAKTKIWIGNGVVVQTLTTNAKTALILLNAGALALRPFTIVRSRFELQLRSDQAAAIEIQWASFGAAVVSDQASAAGVASVPTPFTDMASDLWFVHQNLYGDESALTDRTRSATRVSIDSKAMRKVDIGQDIVIVGELHNGSNGALMASSGRMLVKVN